MFALTIIPVLIAASSPFLQGRSAAYVIGGMAGVIAPSFLLFQPLLAAQLLPGLRARTARRWHLWIGRGLVLTVLVHIVGLYIASPMDALDALLLVSPTPFSIYGVVAMWAVVLTTLLVLLRDRIGLERRNWSLVHNVLGAVIAVATVIHAMQIEGTMGTISKTVLCLCILAVVARVVLYQRVLRPILRRLIH